ncbi:unnamed protein product [Darwinula stevensoni]|uniref:Tektin n=1 Tax=Darwinula stevensoni TaxID=69355 RepID=A0A7R9A5Q3_9CRUS|nr:unnamed protein product [Darwinula stevensoni]CAG0886964.1 unnamed protein product [Darwinula stevensoni]
MAATRKPGYRHSMDDWHQGLRILEATATERREKAVEVRHSAVALRSHSDIRQRWATANSTSRLRDRIQELRKLQLDTSESLKRVEEELTLVEKEKGASESALQSLVVPLETNSQAQVIRDGRRDSDTVNDPVDQCLKLPVFARNVGSTFTRHAFQELDTITSAQKDLAEAVSELFNRQCSLLDAKHSLEFLLWEQAENLRTEEALEAMGEAAPNISEKPHLPFSQEESRRWEEGVKKGQAQGKEEVAKSRDERNKVERLRFNVSIRLRQGREDVDAALRFRIHQQRQAIAALYSQQKKVTDLPLQSSAISSVWKRSVGGISKRFPSVAPRFARSPGEEWISHREAGVALVSPDEREKVGVELIEQELMHVEREERRLEDCSRSMVPKKALVDARMEGRRWSPAALDQSSTSLQRERDLLHSVSHALNDKINALKRSQSSLTETLRSLKQEQALKRESLGLDEMLQSIRTKTFEVGEEEESTGLRHSASSTF